MKKPCKKIAFYGKGGIGKSTIAANVSAALAKEGKQILHIGCDPKSDSTRCLVKKRIPTVIQVLNEKGERIAIDDILFEGYAGTTCVEAGGPEAGVGCAGMGISTTLETLENLGVFEEHWDMVIYDVLGDVVCGGFSIPMRKKCVDQVYIVTSSELMSLYAANNIMKSIVRYSTKACPLFGGLIHNHARSDRDKRIVEYFAALTDSRLVGAVMQNDGLRLNDYRKITVFEQTASEPLRDNFIKLAQIIESMLDGKTPAVLSDAALDDLGKTLYALETEADDGSIH